MGHSKGDNEGIKMLYYQLVGAKAGEKPVFQQQVKHGDNWEPGESETKLWGLLSDIQAKTFNWDDNGTQRIGYKVILYLDDEDKEGTRERIRLEMSFTGMSRALINALLNVEPEELAYGCLKLKCFLGKPREGKTVAYPTLYALLNDEKMGFLYPNEELKPMVLEIRDPDDETKVLMRNYTKLNDFFLDKVNNEIRPHLLKEDSPGKPKPAIKHKLPEEEHQLDEGVIPSEETKNEVEEFRKRKELLDKENQDAGAMVPEDDLPFAFIIPLLPLIGLTTTALSILI